jgi:hypothetical protein
MQKVEFWLDTLCPWAWMTSRWLTEVEKVRDVDITWNVMSLYYLNLGRDWITDEYLENAHKALGPLRVMVAAQKSLGPGVVGDLYTAYGTHIHLQKEEFSRELSERVISELGLPSSLLDSVEDESLDREIIEIHTRGLSLVGEDVGTPIIAVDSTAFFGPVLSPAPKGERAGVLFDAVVTAAQFPEFFELKRTRTVGPIFD